MVKNIYCTIKYTCCSLMMSMAAVSYTHLTLPTSDLVER